MTTKLGLHSSYLSILHSQSFTWTFSHALLTSPTFHVINPRAHRAKGDTVSVRVRAAAVAGLGDEAILALLTKGFFGGWVFGIEGWVMRVCGGVAPACFQGMYPTATKTPTSPSPSLPGYSCVDYGFGSDSGSFAGAHRFAVVRQERDDEAGKEGEEEYVELKLECFRCNPLVNRESWAEWVPWLHY
ncbi:hypothetical protein LHYA1_G004196, partial [Lachnellula hyalina]